MSNEYDSAYEAANEPGQWIKEKDAEILRLCAENERLLESTEYYKNKDAKNGRDISNLVSKTEKLREALKHIHDAVDFPEDTLRRKIRAACKAMGESDE